MIQRKGFYQGMAEAQQNGTQNHPQTSVTGVIFRKTIRASYASLDLLLQDNNLTSSAHTHVIALIQFHDLKEEVTESRSFIRRECKLGTQIQVNGMHENGRFIVKLEKNSYTDSDHTHNPTEQNPYSGLTILQKQKLEMVECQKAREKYYPTFDKINKEKIKVNMHPEKMNSMSVQKKKDTQGTGHGGGLGKKRQGEIVRDFVMALISKQLQEGFDDARNGNEAPYDDGILESIPQSVRHRYVHLKGDNELDDRKMNQVIKFLNNGTGLMDVAGGSGHVSLAFSIKGVKSTVIDPRETVGKLPGRDRKVLRRLMKASRTPQNGVSSGKAVILPPPVEFASLRAWFAKRPAGIDVEFRESGNRTDKIPICSMCSEDDLLPRCSAIVALHPDEATGDIVDFAVTHRLPFVVIPCCVFSRLFPMRFKPLPEGYDKNKRQELVSTYDDLIEYLCLKDESIKVSKLDFDGANIVLWSTFSNEACSR